MMNKKQKIKRMKKILTIALCLFLTLSAMGQNSASENKLLQIIQTELNRNMNYLKEQTVPAYLLTYRIEDKENHSITASSGVIGSSNKSKERALTVQIHVGDKQMGNTREIRGKSEFDISVNMINVMRLSLDDTHRCTIAQNAHRRS